MTDNELLELAARAAGYAKIKLNGDLLFVSHDKNWNDRFSQWIPWSPLEDDGDALRLAVKLWLEVRHVHGASHAGVQGQFWCTEAWFPDGDANAATRRAITRAAAEIGRKME